MLHRLAIVVVALVFALGSAPASANSKYAAVVVDYGTGEVLHSRRAEVSLYPASLTKMMTLVLLFDALEQGELRLDSKLAVSRRAAGMPASKLGLAAGSTISVEKAIQALTVRSANDVAVVIAEALGGSESQFATLMTRRARSFGMTKTVFKNASGLPNREQKSTARDMARLAHRLIRDYTKYYPYFSLPKFAFAGRTYRSHNRLVGSYRGMDGLKTGYTRASGFNLASSAVRDGRRLITVVFGGRSAQTRDAEVARLMDLGFERLRVRGAAPVIAAIPSPKPRSTSNVNVAAVEAPTLPAARPSERASAEATPSPSQISLTADKPSVLDALPDEERRAILAAAANAPVPTANPRDAAAPAEGSTGGLVTGPEKAPATGAYAVQVGAYHDPQLARRAAHDATGVLPQILLLGDIDISPLQGRRQLVYRARVAGFERDIADRACELLREKSRECFVVRTKEAQLAAEGTT